MADREYVEVEVRVIAESNHGLLLGLDNDQGEHWFPSSQIEDPDQFQLDSNKWVTISLTQWIIDQREIEV